MCEEKAAYPKHVMWIQPNSEAAGDGSYQYSAKLG